MRGMSSEGGRRLDLGESVYLHPGTRDAVAVTAASLIAVLQQMPADAPVFVCSGRIGGVTLEHSTPHTDDQGPDGVPSVNIW